MVTNPEELSSPDVQPMVEKTTLKMDSKKIIPKEEPGKFRQIIAAVTVNLIAFAYGTMVGWPSPMTPQLQSDNPPVGTEPMSDESASWLGGVLCIGGLLGTPLFGVIAEKFGRKVAGCLVALPHGICWLVTIFAQDQNYILFARFFAGIGGGGAMLVVPLYVGEIASDNIRGMLGSLLVFFINMGILFTYVVGTLVSFRVFAVCASIIPMIYLAAFVFMPETPIYFVRCGRMTDAGRSLLWLRGGHIQVVEKELESLNESVRESSSSTHKVGIKDLFKTRATIIGVVIAFGLLSGQQLCGIFAIISYSATIFEAAGSSLSPDMAAIVVASIQVLSSYASTVLIERAGRKPLILISCSGMAICHFALGSFSYLQDHGYSVESFRWVPIVALSVYVIVYSLGMGPAPFVVASEVFSPEVSGLANSISMLLLWFWAFVVVKFFATLCAIIGIHGCFFLFGACCVCTFLFTLALVPETKGRTIESILHELNGRSKRKSYSAKYITNEVTLDNTSTKTLPVQV